MTTKNLGLFDAVYANMNYLGQKQKVISQNIANADTPGYKAHELKGTPDFKSILGQAGKERSATDAPALTTTSSSHLRLGGQASGEKVYKDRDQRSTYEMAPSGNSVVIEEQMIKASEVVGEYRMMSNIHEKYLNMMRAATGNR